MWWFLIKFCFCCIVVIGCGLGWLTNPNTNNIQIIFQLITLSCLFYYMYPGYNTFEYEHLIFKKFKGKWSPRILDNGDSMPESIYCLENDTIIGKILQDKDFINKMLLKMENYNLPCISSFHLKDNKIESSTSMPNFIILNNRFHFPNKFDVDMKHQNYYYIFNPIQIGTTKTKDIYVNTHSSLCEWNKDSQENKAYRNLLVQIDCKLPVEHKGKTYIKQANLVFMGELAYCLQDFWIQTQSKDPICK